MSYLSLQHDEWHRIHGKWVTCPLDCGAGERVDDFFAADAQKLLEVVAAGGRGVRCGRCKLHHTSVDAIRFCYAVKYDAETFARNEAARAKEIEEAGDCEHGLSAALCAGPGHYPMDRYED